MQKKMILTIGTFFAGTFIALNGCTPVNKVKRTLALNDLHIQAAVAEDRGDDLGAYELWSEYVNRRPNSQLAEYRLGAVELRLGKNDAAVGHLRVAHDLEPGNMVFLEALSQAMEASGRHESLMRLLRDTVGEGEAGSGYLRLAQYAQEIGQMDEAKEAIESAISQDQGSSAKPYLAMADFAASIGDSGLEIDSLRHVLWFDSADETILHRLESHGLIAGPSLALAP